MAGSWLALALSDSSFRDNIVAWDGGGRITTRDRCRSVRPLYHIKGADKHASTPSCWKLRRRTLKMGGTMRVLEVACAMFIAGIAGALAQAMSEPEALARAEKYADQVVRVIPQRIDGMPNQTETGFGLVVGQRAGKVYVATPYHVAFGKERPSSLSSTPGIIFRQQRYTTIQARRLDRASPNDDLAVIEVAPPSGLTPPQAPLVLAMQLQRGTWVWNIGIGQNWDTPDRAGGLGIEDPITRLRRVSGLRTPGGASGGAGVTAAGVIGMVLQDAGDYSLLLPVERIAQLFTAWDFPVNLLTSQPPKNTSATEILSFEYQDEMGIVHVRKDNDGSWVARPNYHIEQTVYVIQRRSIFRGCNGIIVAIDQRRRPLPSTVPGFVDSPIDLSLITPKRLFIPDAECGRMYIGLPDTGGEVEITNVVTR